MTVTVEMQIKYFSMESGYNQFIVEQTFDTYAEAKVGAEDMVLLEEVDAQADGAMMNSFYYEYDFIMDQSVAEATGLKYTMEVA